MDGIIIEGYYRERRVANVKPLLVEVCKNPETAHLITTDKVKYRYCQLIRTAIKKLIFLVIKLREVSKILTDVEPLLLSDKRIKYLIWGLDAAEARVLLLKIYNDS
jgi:hypothetical protein